MARRPTALGRFLVEILVPEDELRPSPGGVLVALEEGLRVRGYRVLVRSVTPDTDDDTWPPAAKRRPAHPHTPTPA
mgnify:CR=1 FL=1